MYGLSAIWLVRTPPRWLPTIPRGMPINPLSDNAARCGEFPVVDGVARTAGGEAAWQPRCNVG